MAIILSNLAHLKKSSWSNMKFHEVSSYAKTSYQYIGTSSPHFSHICKNHKKL